MTNVQLEPATQDDWVTLSDSALVPQARAGERGALLELSRRHTAAMRALSPTASTRELEAQLVQVVTSRSLLPVRAAWLAAHASRASCHDDDLVVLGRLLDLNEGWRLALWHAEIEGSSQAEIARLLGMSVAEAGLTIRTARSHLLAALVDHSPGGNDQACLDTGALLCGLEADDRAVLDLVVDHGRNCDPCMVRVRRVTLFVTGLRASLLRAVAGDLATTYDALRPAPLRPRAPRAVAASVSRHARPTAMTLAMGGATALAVAALTVGPGALGPLLPPPSVAEAAPRPGILLEPQSAALDLSAQAPRGPVFSPTDRIDVNGSRGAADSAGSTGAAAQGATDNLEPDGLPASGGEPANPEAPSGPGEPTSPTGPDGPAAPPPATDGPPGPPTDVDAGSPPPPPPPVVPTPTLPPVQVDVGPITIDTSGTAPLVSVGTPLPPVSTPPLPALPPAPPLPIGLG